MCVDIYQQVFVCMCVPCIFIHMHMHTNKQSQKPGLAHRKNTSGISSQAHKYRYTKIHLALYRVTT